MPDHPRMKWCFLLTSFARHLWKRKDVTSLPSRRCKKVGGGERLVGPSRRKMAAIFNQRGNMANAEWPQGYCARVPRRSQCIRCFGPLRSGHKTF